MRVRAEGCGGTRVKAVTLLSRSGSHAGITRLPMPESALTGEYTARVPGEPGPADLEFAVEITSEGGRVQRWPRPTGSWLRPRR